MSVLEKIERKLRKFGIGRKQVEEAVNSGQGDARTILKDEEKTQKLIDATLKLCEKLSRLPLIGEVFRDLPLVCMMLSDYIHGNYREVPLATVITLTAVLVYFFSPINLIPNFIPVAGWLDDALAFKLALEAAKNDLEAYAEWKAEQAEYYGEN